MSSLKVPGIYSLHGTRRQHITVSNLNFHSRILKRHSLVKKKFLNFPLLFFRESSGESPVWKNQFFFPVHLQFIKQILSKAVCKKEKNIKNWLLQFSLRGGEHDLHQGMPDIRGMILKNWDTARKMIPSTQNGINHRDSSGNEGLYPIMSPVAATNILHRKTPGRNLLYCSVAVPETVASTLFQGKISQKLINKAYIWKEISEKSLKALAMSKIDIQALNKPILKNVVAGNTLPDINAVSGGTFPVRNAVLRKIFSIRNPVSGSILLGRAALYKDSAILSPTYFPRLEVNLNSRLIASSGPAFEPEPVIGRFPAKEYSLISGKELVFNTGDGVRQVNRAYVRKEIPEKSLKALTLSKRDTQALNQPILKSVVAGNMLPDINTVSRGTFPVRNVVFRKIFSAKNPVSGSILLGRATVYKDSAILSPTYFPRLGINLNSRLITSSYPVFEPESVIDRFPAKEVYPPVSGKELVFNTGDGVRQVNRAYIRKETPKKSLKVFTLSKRDTQALNQPILKSVVAGNMLPGINAVPGGTFPVRNTVFRKIFSIRNSVSGSILPGRATVYKDSAILSPIYSPRLEVNLNSRLISPSGPVFEPKPVVERFPAKEVYPLVSGKELVFNTGDEVRQELEREVAAIKEKLFQAEKASQASYSSIYLKMEEELKQKLEINRISEQVIQQIVWRLNIEKERRGLL